MDTTMILTFDKDTCEMEVRDFYLEHLRYADDARAGEEEFTEQLPFDVRVVGCSATVNHTTDLDRGVPVYTGGEVRVELEVPDREAADTLTYLTDLYRTADRQVSWAPLVTA